MKSKFRNTLVIIFLNHFILSLFGQSFPVNEIAINGDNQSRINIVFLSEGYTIDEMNQFNDDAEAAAIDLMNEPPYEDYESYFNVYCIEVPSNESGTDHPGTASDCGQHVNNVFYADTYFDSSFDLYNIHRLLVIQNYSAAYSVLQNNLPEWDIAFFIVNHTMYGGSGGTFATFSLANSSSEIAIHEIGHSFADLGDEYWAGSQYATEKANGTQESDPNLIKWSSWLYDFNIGIYEYGTGYGWYRPHQSCKMRMLGPPFCSVCVEQTVISIYNILSTIESYQPMNNSISMYQGESLDFIIQKLIPTTNTIDVKWFFNTSLLINDSDTFYFDASNYEAGSHQLQVIASDTTEFVRNDPNSLLVSSVTWDILVEPSITLDIKAFLEGPYSGSEMNPILNSETLPLSQPYNIDPWYYSGTENVDYLPNTNIVDWIMLELRETDGGASSATESTRIAQKALFILKDGKIVDLDGNSNPRFDISLNNQLYAVLWHRNHLGVMSASPLLDIDGVYSYDFSLDSEQAYGTNAQKDLGGGIFGLYGSDGNANGTIDTNDVSYVWIPQAGSKGYKSGDYNMDIQVNNQDKIEVWLPNIGKGCQVPE